MNDTNVESIFHAATPDEARWKNTSPSSEPALSGLRGCGR